MSLAIVGGDRQLVGALATQLHRHGARVVTIGDGETDTSDSIRHLPCDLSSEAEVQGCLNEAESIVGGLPAVVRLAIAAGQSAATELTSLSLDDWLRRAETPLRQAFAFHQAAQRFLADRGGRVLVIVPTVGLSGGPGYVPWATAAEADRSLVKAQARVSGVHGVTINCVAVRSAVLAGTGNDPDRTGLPKPALPEPALDQVARVIVGLLDPAFDGITGQTIAVDGGRWMAP